MDRPLMGRAPEVERHARRKGVGCGARSGHCCFCNRFFSSRNALFACRRFSIVSGSIDDKEVKEAKYYKSFFSLLLTGFNFSRFSRRGFNNW
jgi:hypothetical protein